MWAAVCGLFLRQGLNPYLLHWQVDSLALSQQGSPQPTLEKEKGTGPRAGLSLSPV